MTRSIYIKMDSRNIEIAAQLERETDHQVLKLIGKDRWTYTLRFRQAYKVACLIWPYAHVKFR